MSGTDLSLRTLLIAHLAVTWSLAAMIGWIQFVSYPFYRKVEANIFISWQRRHLLKAGLIIGPFAGVEAATGLWLAVVLPKEYLIWAWWGLGLIVVNGVSTFAVQVPLHFRLERGKDLVAIEALIKTNRLRTACWIVRVAVTSGLWPLLLRGFFQ